MVGQFGRTAYKAYICEIYGHLLKNSLLFLYKFQFSEAYILSHIDFGPIKVLPFVDFADETADLPQPWVGQVGRTFYKAYFCEIYGHLLRNYLLFLYKFKFSEVYISLNIDFGPIKVLSFVDFADQTEKVWQIYPNPPMVRQFGRTAYKAYFCEIYGHLLKNYLLFQYKFKFSGVYIALNIDLGPIKVPSFVDFADETEQLWQIYPNPPMVGQFGRTALWQNCLQSLFL